MDRVPIIVSGDLNKDPAQVCLAKHDQLIDVLPPDRADQSFRIGVLPWRTGRDRLVSGLVSSIEYIRTGKVRALAVTSAKPLETVPDIPTVGDFVPGYEASGWQGIGAPKSTPIEIVEKLNKEINAALADPKMKQRLLDLGGVPMPLTPAAFGQLIADETEKWGKVIRTGNIKGE